MKADVVREVDRIRVHLGLEEPKDIVERTEYFYKYLKSDRGAFVCDVHSWW